MTDFRHPISSCPQLSRMYGMVNYVETEHQEDNGHPFDETVQSFCFEGEGAEVIQD